jgi:DNA polymerase-3 subunit epsilon
MGKRFQMAEVVVLDVETTGTGPTHQVVEVSGVIYETEFEEVIGEFDTLIRPTRSIDSEASEINGLRASDLSMAPTFAEVGPMLARLFHRRPVIAYNVQFDSRILNEEFQRNGIDFQIYQQACAYSPFGERQLKLEEAAKRIGYKLENGHTALADARAALAISAHHGWDNMLSRAGKTEHFSHVKVGSVRTLSRFQAGLTDIYDLKPFSRLREFRDPSVEEGYLLLLDEFLKDKSFSQKELIELDDYANKNQIDVGTRHELHRTYFGALENAALRGGVTEQEAKLLLEYAELLDVDVEVKVTDFGQLVPKVGSLVSHTGDSLLENRFLSKNEVQEIVESRGYIFTDEFRKSDNVALLLVADNGHESGKTRKAEQWGVPMMTIESFVEVTANR